MKYVRLFLVAFIFWVVGVASGLGYVAAVGGWYEYHLFFDKAVKTHINVEGWELVPNTSTSGYDFLEINYLRRPRLVGWFRK